MNRLITLSLCLGVAVCLSIAPGAYGQYALGDGRGLDRSLQQGSYGYNTARVENTAGQYQNALVTGNVGGLSNFRGQIGYRAPGEFSGTLGGDLVYRFQRASAGSSLYRAGTVGNWTGHFTNRFQSSWNGGGQVLSRPGTGAVAGSITGVSSPYGNAATVRNTDSTGAVQLANQLVVRNQRVDAYSFARNAPLTEAGRGGRSLELATGGLDLRLRRPRVNPYGGSAAYDSMNRVTGQAAQSLAGASPAPLDGDQAEQEIPGRLSSRDYRIEPLPLTLGERIGGQIQLSQVNGINAVDSAETARLLSRSLNRGVGDRQVAPGEDVYEDMLRRLRGEEDKKTDDDAPRDRLIVPRESDQAETDDPDLKTDDLGDETGKTEAASDSLQELIKKLEGDKRPVKSLAGSSENFLNNALTRAEQHMANKRYFDADSAYAAALVHKPDHPLAVAGRVHAQLGAGLYLSATRTLRKLLNAHPELITTKYESPLLPPAERLAKSRQHLEHQLEITPKATEPALMLAYIAYQQGDHNACNRALDELKKRNPEDTLIPLLRRLWVDPTAVASDPPEITDQ